MSWTIHKKTKEKKNKIELIFLARKKDESNLVWTVRKALSIRFLTATTTEVGSMTTETRRRATSSLFLTFSKARATIRDGQRLLIIETERDDSPLEIAVGGTEVSHHRVVLDLQVEARVSIDGFLAGIIPRSTDCRDESFEGSRDSIATGRDGDVLVVVGREPRIRIRGRVEEDQVSSIKRGK